MPNDITQLKTPIEEFQPDPNQPRKYFDEKILFELSESIKQYGVLQPIIYYVNEDGQKIIVARERGYPAAKRAIVIRGSDADKVALIENILRQDLTPLEEAEALQWLENYKLTLGFLKSLLGKLNKSNIVISNNEEKENLKSHINQLSNAINEFLNRYNFTL